MIAYPPGTYAMLSGDPSYIIPSSDQAKNIPLVITRAKTENKNAPIVLFISGDGGWYKFEQSIADNLSLAGIPTLGIDSKKYFWTRKTPDETASDLLKMLNQYSREWERSSFVLIGYSLGAEIVPFVATRLNDLTKTSLVAAVLLSPTGRTDFEVHFSDMLGMGRSETAYNVIDEINKIKDIPVLLIYGEGEKTKVPDLLTGKTIKLEKIPGDHHYRFNIPLIVDVMKSNNIFRIDP